ncbi:endolytic transglycosylase MltG [uncultured Ezakiella sp.]|uniref:endolytic transglycosylase MltG n=1 Tax=uncultured Ezakiella sp. TaxID=1637529 RepID=UPI0025DAC5C4|nr:endolytic transglycosylase MltG [uncultured Ezakiella sp.]
MNTAVKWILTFALLLAIVFVAIFGFKAYNKSMYKPVDKNDTSLYEFSISKGSSLSTVASSLYDMNLIKNGSAFKSRVEELGLESEIQSGKFKLSRSMDVDQVITELTKKPETHDDGQAVKLVIPEGFERKLIAERIEELGLGSAQTFMELTEDKGRYEEEFPFLKSLAQGQSLEGFLFPATYELSASEGEESIIKKMLTAFEVRMENNFNQGSYNGLDLNQMITLASIIEREIKIDDERPLASSVFYNRINQGMRLQSCATVQYIIGERKAVLTNEETQIDSPYNTYINEGLPPAPIASPGMKSIMAAINPADTEYLFFVKTGEDGSHSFSKTYEEHLEHKKDMIR